MEPFIGVAAVPAQQTEDEDLGFQAGPYAFFFFVALALATIFLLFSMRKQMRRVDFDERGTTDDERMGGVDDAERRTEDDADK